MHESLVHAESLYRRSASFPQLFRYVRGGVVHQVEFLFHNVSHRRPHVHALKQHVALAVAYRVVATNHSGYEFLHDVSLVGLHLEEVVKVSLVLNLKRVGSAHAYLRLAEDRVANSLDELLGGFPVGNSLASGRRHSGFLIELLHPEFALYVADSVVLYSSRYVEVGAQACVLFEPKLVHALYPVNLSVFEAEERHCLEHLFVIAQVLYSVVFCQ